MISDTEWMRQVRTPTAKEAFEQIIALRGYQGSDEGRMRGYAVCAEVAEKGLKALVSEQGANETRKPEKSFQKEEKLFRENENIELLKERLLDRAEKRGSDVRYSIGPDILLQAHQAIITLQSRCAPHVKPAPAGEAS